MKLTYFEIAGHSVLQDLAVEVRDHLVIVGANDVGKTSVLRLLNLLLGATVQQLYQALGPQDLREGVDRLVVTARLEDFSEEEQSQFPFAMSVVEGQPNFLLMRLEVAIAEDDHESIII